MLPVSGTTVTIEAWKLVTSTVVLGDEIDMLKVWLAANEISTGRYLHSSRFVASCTRAGWSTTAAPRPRPARCSTRHFTAGPQAGEPERRLVGRGMDGLQRQRCIRRGPVRLHRPPVELSPRNPWRRVTPPASYTSGERFFEGVAADIGVGDLRLHMSNFYLKRNARPATTADLEAFLVSRSDSANLVDAFHRFVYGLADPSPVLRPAGRRRWCRRPEPMHAGWRPS